MFGSDSIQGTLIARVSKPGDMAEKSAADKNPAQSLLDKANGSYDDATERAVIEFQRRNALVVEQQALGALEDHAPWPVPKDSSEEVAAIKIY